MRLLMLLSAVVFQRQRPVLVRSNRSGPVDSAGQERTSDSTAQNSSDR